MVIEGFLEHARHHDPVAQPVFGAYATPAGRVTRVLLIGAAAIRAAWELMAATIVDASAPAVSISNPSRLSFQSAPADLFR